MNAIGEALPWVAFWAVIGLLVWVSHVQYMAGHDSLLFAHKTPEELRIREAVVKKLERAASQPDRSEES